MSIHVSIRTASPDDIRAWLDSDEFVDLSDLPSCRVLPLDRDWDALHYLLTGSVSSGRGPAAFLKTGGLFVQQGGNDRLFRPFMVGRIAEALMAMPMPLIRSRFNPERMEKVGVYLGSWDYDPPHEGVLFDVVRQLKVFVRQASKRGDWLTYSDDA